MYSSLAKVIKNIVKNNPRNNIKNNAKNKPTKKKYKYIIKQATPLKPTNITSPFHISYGGIYEGIYAKNTTVNNPIKKK
jgi:hypothetical protein